MQNSCLSKHLRDIFNLIAAAVNKSKDSTLKIDKIVLKCLLEVQLLLLPTCLFVCLFFTLWAVNGEPVAFSEYVSHAADMGIKSHRNENKIQKFTQGNLVSVKKNLKRKSEMKLISNLLFQYGLYNLSYQ